MNGCLQGLVYAETPGHGDNLPGTFNHGEDLQHIQDPGDSHSCSQLGKYRKVSLLPPLMTLDLQVQVILRLCQHILLLSLHTSLTSQHHNPISPTVVVWCRAQGGPGATHQYLAQETASTPARVDVGPTTMVLAALVAQAAALGAISAHHAPQ